MPIEITWLCHAWFSLKADSKLVHFDPLSEKYKEKLGARIPMDESSKADLILISHSRGDH
ncbi:MAG: MBL fold metallo-hydrolase [Methanomassiliicoccales archaeon]|nr:MBL fold metallo-hydrolase [Methanomassiliicoccales archaeon]